MSEEEFMREAIEIAIRNVKNGGGPFGAVIVRDGKIIAKGNNQVTVLNDPTAHAEVMAIRAASTFLGDFNLSECEIYSSCEPCPMCLGAIYWARLKKVYFGASNMDAAQYGFDDLWIENELKKDIPFRTLSMTQIQKEESIKAFLEWENFLGKKKY